ncbi:acyl-CoA dehydrogenase family protein [Angustibacter sp. Root456]|uniref:acyl-CoA dehydrogenase family protein n=1 Tax=Angustibacter sp. Root456 TaxID=1736539 RepID=UPI0006F95865|nr:acyl-CoA dehydrogenase family protein [Angustibacter sp. Root456]KQX62814.1 acyl-CoA dehydrogenase [Angustibacter sp. Root456]
MTVTATTTDRAPEDLRTLRAEVRALVDRWQDEGRFTPGCDAWLRSYDLDFSRELGAHGWIGITWPTELGGGGRSNRARLVVTEELLRAGAPVAAHWIADRQIGPAILRYGSPELQRTYLPRIASGEATFCLGMSETESGSDLASVRTTATPVEGGGWRVRGRKIWTSQAHRSTHAYLLARTSRGESKHEGLTELLVDMSAEGVEVRPIYDLRGEHHFNEITFDDVLVPADHLLGEVGGGWGQVTEQLAFERGGMERVLSTYPLLAAVVDELAGADGDLPVGSAAAVGTALARLHTLRQMAWRIAAAVDAGDAPVLQAAMLKDLGTTFERDVDELARAVVDVEADPAAGGVAGLLAQGVLAAPGFSIRGGTTEVLRTIIARGAKKAVSGTQDGGDLRSLADDVLSGRGGEPDGLPAVWQTVVELGWPGVGLAEEDGGSGGEPADLAQLVEATGRHVVPVPLAEAALAARLLAGAGFELPDGVAVPVLGARGEQIGVHRDAGSDASDGVVLSGLVRRVPWARTADHLVVLARGDDGTDLVALVPRDATGVGLTEGSNLAGEPRDDVRLDDVRVPGSQVRSADTTADDALAWAALLRAAATVGALETAVAHTVEHVSVREQFGKPLLRFQAVAQQVAVMTSQLALARTATAFAVGASQGAAGVDQRAVAVAVVAAATAATEVARAAHQLHGAMGVTREHPLHLATRRLWSWRDECGGERRWAARLATDLVPGGSDAVWRWLTQDETDTATDDTTDQGSPS